MKIRVYKNPQESITLDYDFSKILADNVEQILLAHCKVIGVDPILAAVTVLSRARTIKHTTTKMTMKEVAARLINMQSRELCAGRGVGGNV